MTKSFLSFLITLLFSTTGIAEICINSSALPFNSTFASGPAMMAIVKENSAIGAVIYRARDQWNVTDAAGHIGNWNGNITTSDCPANQPRQIGAYEFANTAVCSIPLPTDIEISAYSITGGTRSIAINLNRVWSLNPLPGQYDIESVLSHEFGHMLGMAHQRLGICDNDLSPPCATYPNIETMGSVTHPGETCQRNLEAGDSESANFLY